MQETSFITILAVAGTLLGLMALVVAVRVVRFWIRALLCLLALVILVPAGGLMVALHPEWIDGRFRTYKAFYGEIHPGMDREDVLRLVDRHYPAAGPRRRPKVVTDEPGRLGFLMDPERFREPNCEGIFLTLTNGRVAAKWYSAD